MKEKLLHHGFAVGGIIIFILLGLACATQPKAREVVQKTAITVQRVRSTIMSDLPVEFYIDEEILVLSNGQSTSVLVNNGEHIVYAVLGDIESKSSRVIANSKTLNIVITARNRLIGGPELLVEAKEVK